MKGLWPQTLIRFYQLSIQISMNKQFLYLITVLLVISCDSKNSQVEDPASKKERAELSMPVASEKQLNINILWDLSDRINDKVNPSTPPHYQRDVEIIRHLTEIFKKDMQTKGSYKAKSKIKVFFSPTPANNEINKIAKSLSYDLSSFTGEQANRKKKEVYDSITPVFMKNALQIYNLTVQDKENRWEGSDIWRFFKNNVRNYCIDDRQDYRNILVIITDGYLYHKDSKEKSGNKTTYILPETLKPFRKNEEWQQLFEHGNYGLICTRNDLKSLEILVLEITPAKDHKNDEDILKTYLEKWFTDMGVLSNNFACYNTDLPEYTKQNIERFVGK